MKSIATLRSTYAGALALGLLFAQVALGHGHGDAGVTVHGDVADHVHGHGNESALSMDQADYPPTYFAHPDHVGLVCAHIALMVLAWVFVLPVAVMLSLAKSRYTLASQFVFLATNAFGLLLATIYNAQTPDLYPNNAHHKLGWVVTWVVSAQVLVSLVGWVAGAVGGERSRRSPERLAFIPVSPDPVDGGYRMSNDSGQGSEPKTESLRSNSVSTLDDDEGLPMPSPRKDEYEGGDQDDDHFDDMLLSPPAPASPLASKAATVISSRVWKYLDLLYRVIDRIILPFGFAALTTGIVTFGRFFSLTRHLAQQEGNGIFSGLAHWVKGGVFFWFGLFTLSRWSGSFGELGWAWNMRPRKQQHKWCPTAEFVESALIFFYGSTSIFLEHLGSSGGEWSAQDLEHMAITVLFIGGGLCGMLIESTRIRDLLNTGVSEVVAHDAVSDEERQQRKPPATYKFSMNPVPALVILLLGVMMSSHPQSTMISSMVHRQWGNLLLGASFARGLTYVLMFLRPPKSVLPSRPPTELLASFGLIAGGIIFMASSSDTITGMIHYDLDAMFVYTITMGLVVMLMAWEVVVLAIKGWATRKERRGAARAFP
ncbi:putative membrane protein C3B8.06 [Tolypocladium ophioglossoides CBS 100239]|uniref:Putative membrane protein C3B8.06 n=1 Tax=Tolypocladium ophioglossoides (strain CBS 100239) TaxID=1163406 RepID=A0A0L0NA57_TOLOC|nr:putative membrane protein C3B8.06 [Tolypocladium ophioglossoides CBS 100239]